MVRSRVPRKILGVIPARYASSRFPGKALARIDSRTMLEHVFERASMARYLSTVLIATDDRAHFRGGPALRRARRDDAGGSRLGHGSRGRGRFRFEDAELVVNIQGDEPLIDPDAIDAAVLPLLDEPAIPWPR